MVHGTMLKMDRSTGHIMAITTTIQFIMVLYVRGHDVLFFMQKKDYEISHSLIETLIVIQMQRR